MGELQTPIMLALARYLLGMVSAVEAALLTNIALDVFDEKKQLFLA